MQYKKLLEKYIHHVRDCEGTDFLMHINSGCGRDVKFTAEEWQTLEELSAGYGAEDED